ncbi:MAG: ABC transporter permease [Thermoleophilia bacterium]|nr:ABC transporter permease [Thermoleophilia bacterium]
MRTALLIARKDLRQRIRDRSAFLWGLVAPFGLAAIFSFVFNPISDADFHAEYVVVNQDQGAIADAFLQQLQAMERQGIITARTVGSPEEARGQVETGSDAFAAGDEPRADAAFILPSGLSERVLAGQGGR